MSNRFPGLAALACALILGGLMPPSAAMAQEPRMAVIASRLPATKDYYPYKAAENEVTGGARVLCTVLETGRLGDCKIVEQRPTHYGFGAAVKDAAEDMIVVDLTVHKPGDRVFFDLHFGLSTQPDSLR